MSAPGPLFGVAAEIIVEARRCFFGEEIKAETVSLKSEIEHQLAIPVRLRLGAPGAFRVLLNGEEIYSKKQSGRLPNSDEIVKFIRKKNGKR